ncbi:AAA family ATPase [Nodosilinea sp. P-1105]|uniref:AAA family ATPase n=1 Tax=Nodosilinea sp. P-1105 TaxID=2546229 RepID=UPI00146C08CF|nr:AAA family ATPase [Nodosilinea sp. P-1105]NMF86299.1 hypothetical protein [Nodosilinea sp. P-1105]
MVDFIKLLRNVGQFDSVNLGEQLPLSKLNIIYAENGRGKTTLSTILHSLGTNNSTLIEERHRLGAIHPPHIVIQADGQNYTFQGGSWQASLPKICVFDDNFVAQNIYSGIEIESDHRQNLHGLILGAEGMRLNDSLQIQIDRIQEHNRALREKESAIPASVRGTLTVESFCALNPRVDIDSAIQETIRHLEAAKDADAIRQRPDFKLIELPAFDLSAINHLLQRDLPSLQQEAAEKVQRHLEKLGREAENWIGDGMNRIAAASNDEAQEICPFCAQALQESPLINHYQGYFSNSYTELKKSIIEQSNMIAAAHSTDVQTAFERAIQTIREAATYWKQFTDIPTFEINTVDVALAWKVAREPILNILRAKATAPLEKITLPDEVLEAVTAYEGYRQRIAALSQSLHACNSQISVVKERAAEANIAALNADLENLKMLQRRYSPSVDALCKAYQDEKEAKIATENRRTQARQALDSYRSSIFQTYQTAINGYLQKFLASFRLNSITPQNTRGGTSCTYDVLINTVVVPINAGSGASFKNTMSAGDRNTLALAFFFASLDKDTNLDQKIVVIDDPMTSLDEHRSLATIQEIIGLTGRVKKVIVLSHSKPFLCQLWNDAEKAIRSTPRKALHIIRSGNSSTIEEWDVHLDCITEHDKRHTLIAAYMDRADPNNQRLVASALRPTIEAFLRVAYPIHFPPGTMLGPFLHRCSQLYDAGNPILSQADIAELTQLTNYANKFHHDSNPAYATEIINDQTLHDYCRRTLNFAKRG